MADKKKKRFIALVVRIEGLERKEYQFFAISDTRSRDQAILMLTTTTPAAHARAG